MSQQYLSTIQHEKKILTTINSTTFIMQYIGYDTFQRQLREIRSAPEKFRNTYLCTLSLGYRPVQKVLQNSKPFRRSYLTTKFMYIKSSLKRLP